jgi:hypothetical protein
MRQTEYERRETLARVNGVSRNKTSIGLARVEWLSEPKPLFGGAAVTVFGVSTDAAPDVIAEWMPERAETEGPRKRSRRPSDVPRTRRVSRRCEPVGVGQ